ncbi:DUF2303 family protein [Bosea sp. LjRoot9]|uniref:DUF2303 family protein n=1 Tax=Bosea sp. LjRoot9 TaxID=3342341 RepID=UPI003ECDF94B
MANKTAAEPATLEAIAGPFCGGGYIPDGDAGLRTVIELTQDASNIEIIQMSTAGLGAGLPATIPILIDRRRGGAITTPKPLVEQWRQEPAEISGQAQTTTLQSFIDLVNRHKNDGSAVFGKTAWPEPALTAVIDYHGEKASARWGKHRIRYAFPITEEFKVWIEKNGKPMDQATFAAFLEDHAAELSAAYGPEAAEYEALFKERFATPTDLIALSRNLEVFVNAKVKQGVRIQTGERVVEFVEEHMNGKGEKVEIPGIFMVSVPAFIDGAAVRIPARLRYRIAGGEIQWFYQLYRWQFWLRDQVKNDLDTVKQQTELPTFEGSPEA